jgi:hypothetical protein
VDLRSGIDDLNAQLRGMEVFDAAGAGMEAERQWLITELQQLQIAVAVDLAAVKAIEEEGRRAGALPGWFRN